MIRALWKACAHRPLLAGAQGLVEQQMHQMSSLMTGVNGLGSCRSPVPATLVPRAFAQSLHHAGGAHEAPKATHACRLKLIKGHTQKRSTARSASSSSGMQASTGGTGGGGGFASGGGGGGGSGAGGGSSGLWSGYLRLLETQPVFTKAWTAALLNAVGDILAQKVIEKEEHLDLKRLGIFSFLGFVLVGPALHYWYQTLGRVVTATGSSGAVIRMMMDQLLFAPFFLSTFITSLMTLEGHASDVPAKLRQDLKPTLIANWKVWVPFQFINFRFVPQSMQVLASNVVAVGWNTYMSMASHSAVAPA